MKDFRFHGALDFRPILRAFLRIQHSDICRCESEFYRRTGDVFGIGHSTTFDFLSLDQMLMRKCSKKTTRPRVDIKMSTARYHAGAICAKGSNRKDKV